MQTGVYDRRYTLLVVLATKEVEEDYAMYRLQPGSLSLKLHDASRAWRDVVIANLQLSKERYRLAPRLLQNVNIKSYPIYGMM